MAGSLALVGEVATLDTLAKRAMDMLVATIQGHSDQPPLTQEYPHGLRAAIQHAYNNAEAVTIDYFGPARGAITTWRIEPVRLYAREGITYIEAWYGLDGEPRTFRMDRIVRIVNA